MTDELQGNSPTESGRVAKAANILEVLLNVFLQHRSQRASLPSQETDDK